MTAIQIKFSEESKERLALSVAEKVELRIARMLSRMQLGNPPEDTRTWRSRREVAEMLGYSTRTVQRWEKQYGLTQDPAVGGQAAAYPLEEVARIQRVLSEAKASK